MSQKPNYIVILFYKFINIADPKALVRLHKEKASQLGLTGRVFIAGEGINATLEGTAENIKAYGDFLHKDPLFSDVLIKESKGNGMAFSKLTIKVRPEVVTLSAGKFDIQKETAPTITADELEELYEKDEDFVILDLRNDYEISAGKFEKTIDPGLTNFRDLPDKLKDLEYLKEKKVIPVCTGGIRCEKATCLLKKEGFKNVYQLKDGIHTYMQKYPGRYFKGTLFVFDNRMTTDVVENPNKEIIGRCVFCNTATENFCSDDGQRPSRKILCCHDCFNQNASTGKLRLSTTL